jgi:hypothetical protein
MTDDITTIFGLPVHAKDVPASLTPQGKFQHPDIRRVGVEGETMQTQEKPTDSALKTNIIIDRKHLQWSASALSTDGYRKALGYASVETHQGKTWLITTDTVRMHWLRLDGPAPKGHHLLDIRRMIHEAKFVGGIDGFGLSFDEGKPMVEMLNSKGDSVSTIVNPLTGTGTFPNCSGVMEKTDWEGSFPGAAFNFHLLKDMGTIAASNKVILMGGKESRPFVVAEKRCDPFECAWFAVIMPMALQ